MTRSGHIAVVVGNPRPHSRTTALALAVAERLQRVAARPLRIETCELAALGEAETAQRDAVDLVLGADALVIASPVYKATYTGLLKTFLDRFGAGSLGGVPCAALMLGGSPAHSLAPEVHLRPLLAELGASTLPSLYVTEPELPDLDEQLDEWWARCDRLIRFFTQGKEAPHA